MAIRPVMQKSASARMGSPPGWVIMSILRPPSAPAKKSSGMPSGSGMTAATVMDGGPPTKMFTLSDSPRARASPWWCPMPRWIW